MTFEISNLTPDSLALSAGEGGAQSTGTHNRVRCSGGRPPQQAGFKGRPYRAGLSRYGWADGGMAEILDFRFERQLQPHLCKQAPARLQAIPYGDLSSMPVSALGKRSAFPLTGVQQSAGQLTAYSERERHARYRTYVPYFTRTCVLCQVERVRVWV